MNAIAETIARVEPYMLLRASLALFKKPPAGLDAGQLQRAERQARNEFEIESRVLRSSEAAGVIVTDAELDAAYREVCGRFDDDDEFDAALLQNGLDAERLRAALFRQCKVNTVMEKVASRSPEVSEVEIGIYYHTHPDKFNLPERRAVRNILITTNPEYAENSREKAMQRIQELQIKLQSDQLAQRVEEIILEQPEVVATARRTGRAELDPHAQQVFASEIDVSLKMQQRSKAEFLSELRKALTSVPGTAIVIGQPISHRIDHMLSGTRANIAIKLFGQDLADLRRLAEQVKKLTEQISGAVDVAIDNPADVPFLDVKFNRQALARYGLSIGTVAEAIETAFAGRAVSRVIEDVGSFDLVVRYGPEALEDLQTIRSTLIMTPSGAQLPLHALADIRKTRGPNTISRENAQRKIVVMANVAERDLAGVVRDIQTGIEEQIRFPKGYYVEYGGQFESAEQASKTLFIVGFIVIVGIFLLLFVAFRSAGDALLVMLNLPLALIGGVIGVYCADGILSVASIIGFITLFGIATRNGVMMISHIHHLVLVAGIDDLSQAVKQGALERLSPILMTALGTGLALIPLSLSGGEPGSEIQAPMALVILFGLLTSTALNMLVIPALYYRFGSMRKVVKEL